MADQTPSSSGVPSGSAASARVPRRTGAAATGRHHTSRAAPSSSQQQGASQSQQHPAALRRGGHRHMSTRDINQMLSEMGSYTKYSKSVLDCKWDVKLRCQCGRSRNMAWMFLCTVCASGTKVEKAEEDNGLSKYGYGLTGTTSSAADDKDKEKEKEKEKENDEKDDGSGSNKQRPFLCCDLCAHKITETYYCPNCLNAYPAQYVKQQTRCPRCVACPICVSPLEKIVYAGGPSSSSNDDATGAATKKDSLATPGSEKTGLTSQTQKIEDESGDATSKDDSTKKKTKDVYLYQCPFCFWSSNSVGLEAPTSDILNQHLTNKIKQPYDKKLSIMHDIEEKYNTMNEELRKEEERLYNARHYHKTYKTKNLFDLSGSSGTGASGTGTGVNINGVGGTGGAISPRRRGKRKKTSRDFEIPNADGTYDISKLAATNNPESASAMEKLKSELDERFKKNHTISQEKADNSHVPKLDMIFVQAFNIQHVSPLSHRLKDPLHQHKDFHKFVPQRFHLMTKESFKCPNEVCEQYVCKPHLRGAQANFEKRTAVLDFLPRVVMEVVSGDLVASATSTILVKFQNRHMEDAKLTIDCSINEKDPLSTAKVECSNLQFEMDPINIHIKGGSKKERKDENGDYIDGKEVGIHFKVTPKYYAHKDIKFSIRVMFETQLEVKKDKAGGVRKTEIRDIKFGLHGKQPAKDMIDCELPFILDFDLGAPKKTDISSRKQSGATAPTSSSPSVMENSRSSSTQPSLTSSVKNYQASSGDASSAAQSEAQATGQSGDASEETNESGHRSRGSNELDDK